MNDNPVFKRIQSDIEGNPVVLYMKGTPMFPQCGFSAAVVQVLTHVGVEFKGVDVLTDPPLRDGIKQFSNWPTIPQLYVKGRIRRRLRYRARDVRFRRTDPVAGFEGHCPQLTLRGMIELKGPSRKGRPLLHGRARGLIFPLRLA